MSTSFYVYETQVESKGDDGMNEKLRRCKACTEFFRSIDDVIEVEDDVYHKDCVTLVPVDFFVMLGEEPIGMSENEDGSMAFDVLDEGEYLDD